MREFAVEQYMPGADAVWAQCGAKTARAAAEGMAQDGAPVEFVRSIFIPDDETSIYIFKAASVEALRAALAGTPLRFERVSEAVTQTGTAPNGGGTNETEAASNRRRNRGHDR